MSIGPIVTGVGFGMMIGVEPRASYWSGMLPAIVVIALGMAGAVAPLTAAVLSSVDGRHTGTASGFNSAVARTGGLIATALAGAVMATSGAALAATYHGAAAIAAVAAIVAGVIGYCTLGRV